MQTIASRHLEVLTGLLTEIVGGESRSGVSRVVELGGRVIRRPSGEETDDCLLMAVNDFLFPTQSEGG